MLFSSRPLLLSSTSVTYAHMILNSNHGSIKRNAWQCSVGSQEGRHGCSCDWAALRSDDKSPRNSASSCTIWEPTAARFAFWSVPRASSAADDRDWPRVIRSAREVCPATAQLTDISVTHRQTAALCGPSALPHLLLETRCCPCHLQ